MKLTVDLVPSEAAANRRANVAFVLGLFIFASGLFYYSWTSQQLERTQADVDRLTQELDQLQKKAESARDPAREAAEQKKLQWHKYRDTFPWNDLFAALEALPPLQVKDFFASADEGRASIELTGPDANAVLAGVDNLTKSLPEWEILLRSITSGTGEVSASLELQDRRKPK